MSDQDTKVPLQKVLRAKTPQPELEPVEPTSLPERKAAEPPLAIAAEPPANDPASYRRRVLLVLSAIAVVLGLYWASGYFFAYTDDAYVTSDLVGVAPQISGRIVAVHIVDNQTVTKGMLLAEIDPQP